MRKILLASRGTYVTDGKYDLFDKPRNEIKWAYITTARKSVPNVEYIKKHEQRMRELGWDFEILDINGKTPDQLRQALADKEAINMLGGNTFFLIKCIRESGFRDVLEEFLARGGVYCGSSAGSYVACPSIEMATWKDDKAFDGHGVTDFTGMNMVPFLIVAHCTLEIITIVKPHIEQSKYDVKLLNDQQAIQIKDNQIEYLEDLNIQSKDFGG
ncbi:MAG: Type 1 glutamine amidotransferase-like domain-containing protein [Patescibacteria group bacterium]|jgi:dipeptidase E